MKEYKFLAPTSLIEELDKIWKKAGYNSRSEAIRAAIREHINHMKRRIDRK